MNSAWRAVLVLGMLVTITACGRKGALIYPDMLVPAAPTSVSAQVSGSFVKLQCTLPDKDRAGRPLQGVAGVRIRRLVTETSRKDECRACLTDYQLFRTLYLDHLPLDTQRFGNVLMFMDSDVSAGKSYSYRMVPFTADNTDGAASAVAIVHVAAPVPAPVARIESFPTEVKLHFSSAPLLFGRLVGFNLYRSSGMDVRSFLPLNRELLKGTVYTDATLERGVKYRYRVRAVIEIESGERVESAESEEVEGVLKDDE